MISLKLTEHELSEAHYLAHLTACGQSAPLWDHLTPTERELWCETAERLLILYQSTDDWSERPVGCERP